MAQSLYRAYPDRGSRSSGDEAISIAVRDRLNTSLAGMVDQHRRIEFIDLRDVANGKFAAMVIANKAEQSPDRILVESQGSISVTGQKSRVNRRDKSLSQNANRQDSGARPPREREALNHGSENRR